jgi:hypothetical protein
LRDIMANEEKEKLLKEQRKPVKLLGEKYYLL